MNASKAGSSLQFAVGYAYGRIENIIDGVAASSSGEVTAEQLTRQLGQHLLFPSGAAPESASSNNHQRVLSAKGRANISKAQKARWAKARKKVAGVRAYWASMSPAERSRVMKQRRKVAAANRKAKAA